MAEGILGRPRDALRGAAPSRHRSARPRRLLRRVREQRRELRDSGRLDGTLEEVRRLLDQALGQERAALFPDPVDDARLREAELDTLPRHRARDRQLSEYHWRSPQARRRTSRSRSCCVKRCSIASSAA